MTVPLVRQYFGSCPEVVRQYFGSCPEVVVTLASLLRHHSATLLPLPDDSATCPEVVRQYFGSRPAVLWQLSGSTSAVVQQYFGSCPAVHLCHPKVIVFVVSPYCDWSVALLWQRAVG